MRGLPASSSYPAQGLSADAWAGFAPPNVAKMSRQVNNLFNMQQVKNMHASVVNCRTWQVKELLSAEEHQELEALCGRCLANQLKTIHAYDNAHKVHQCC